MEVAAGDAEHLQCAEWDRMEGLCLGRGLQHYRHIYTCVTVCVWSGMEWREGRC